MSRLHTQKRSATLTFAMMTVASTPLILATAGTVTIASAPLTAVEAQAFGWSDIKKGAKKVGSAVKKGAKKTGSVAKKVGKGTAKAAGKVAKKAGNAGLAVAGEAYKAVGIGGVTLILKATGDYDEDAKRRLEVIRRNVDKYMTVDQVGRVVGRGAKKVGKVIIGRNKIGESLPRPDKSKAENALADYMNRRGRVTRKTYSGGTMKPGIVKGGRLDNRARAPVKGITRKNAARRITGRVRAPEGAGDKFRDKAVKQRPIIGRDKSVRGRPFYGISRKVKGIAKRDAQPRHTKDIRVNRDGKRSGRRPYWKKYRENPPASKSNLTRNSKRANHVRVGRDKSVRGRPVYSSRRKMNTRRKFNTRRTFESRSSSRRSFNRRNRSMGNRFKRRFDQRRQTRRMSSSARRGNRGNRRR